MGTDRTAPLRSSDAGTGGLEKTVTGWNVPGMQGRIEPTPEIKGNPAGSFDPLLGQARRLSRESARPADLDCSCAERQSILRRLLSRLRRP